MFKDGYISYISTNSPALPTKWSLGFEPPWFSVLGWMNTGWVTSTSILMAIVSEQFAPQITDVHS
jgi:hypothetical protein